jgi:hypothetical protein
MGNTAKRDAKAAATAEKANQALNFRKLGLSLHDIGERLGCSKQYVHELVQRAIGDIPKANAEMVRLLELEKLDRYEVSLQKKIATGDTQAIACAIRISERRAKLEGLDAAVTTKTELTGAAGGPITTIAMEDIQAAMKAVEQNAAGADAVDAGGKNSLPGGIVR